MSFSKYSKQAPQAGRTVPFTFRGLKNPDGSHPVVHVEHLGESNRPFWLEEIARAGDRLKAAAAVGNTPADMMKAQEDERAVNREKVIRFSARSMESVFHDDGTPAGDADLPNFIRSVPDADFELLWGFVQLVNPFRDYSVVGDPKEIAEK